MELSVRISLRSFFVINKLIFFVPCFYLFENIWYAFENKPNDRLALWISCSGSKIQLCIQPWLWEVCYHIFGVPLDTWQNGGPKRRGRKRSGSFPEKWKKVKGGHTVPAQKSNISKKIIGGKSLTFSFLKIIRRLLLFARLSYYFTPYNRLTDYSLQVHKLTKSSTLLSFWPAGFILPPNHWKFTDIFFPKWTLWARCADWINEYLTKFCVFFQ